MADCWDGIHIGWGIAYWEEANTNCLNLISNQCTSRTIKNLYKLDRCKDILGKSGSYIYINASIFPGEK